MDPDPSRPLVAGVAISLADPGGPIELAKETTLCAGREARHPGHCLFAGNLWALEGIGVQAQDLGDHGKQRRWVDTLLGCPTRLGEDLGLEEADQQPAQLAPDPLGHRDLGQEPGDLGVEGLQVQLASRIVRGHDCPLLAVLLTAQEVNHRALKVPRVRC
jgi:hypothetical protein